ncbi:uncharacterized protein LOC143180294 [Calliopsis andreniformis]|uniref:uncharacterized protein LOC143180294 n=1 Tax=Calliopsis andreniformis TaxID=337506 RepID=UPI003FCD35C0
MLMQIRTLTYYDIIFNLFCNIQIFKFKFHNEKTMDKKTYKKYKRRIAEAQAKINNEPPKFKVSTYYKPRNLSIDANRIRRIDTENMVMLRRMNIITRLGGIVDCWVRNIKYRSDIDDPQIRNNNIMRSNKVLLKNIRNTVSNYPTAEFIRNWKDMKLLSLHSKKNTPFHRIVSGYWCQGGDITKFNGSGGSSIYGDSFENENFNLRHAGPGVLSMYSNNENKNDSKFNLTFKRLDTMNGKHVVFGKIISGFSNIYKIEEFGTKTGKPIKTIIISNCGIIPRKKLIVTKKKIGI